MRSHDLVQAERSRPQGTSQTEVFKNYLAAYSRAPNNMGNLFEAVYVTA
jgi:hypothetical protein